MILAAGASSRMGQSKQLLNIRGKSLLTHAVEAALECKESDTAVVVLGANSERHKIELVNQPIRLSVNENWESGMGSSIKSGLINLLDESPQLQSVLIMLIDQPKVSAPHLSTLLKSFKDFNKSIVASFYGNTPGVPAVFSKAHFDEIMTMDDGAGAKKIIERHPTQLLTIGFPEGNIDLDTPDDYYRYIQGE
jgi:molybdenum cofactor cytidylyltransferase